MKPYQQSSPPYGTCHICRRRDFIAYCDTCGHWLCVNCRNRWLSRGAAFIRELIGGPRPGCCGPGV